MSHWQKAGVFARILGTRNVAPDPSTLPTAADPISFTLGNQTLTFDGEWHGAIGMN